MKCIYCGAIKLYKVTTTQLKCSQCKRKFSTKKIILQDHIIDCFINDLTVLESSKLLNINYITTQRYYYKIRMQISLYLESQYNTQTVSAYEEYVYLEKSKRNIKRYIFDAQSFLTFLYNNDKIYNILMPSLQNYKQQFSDDGLEEVYFKAFSRYMMFNKISKLNKNQNTIKDFWNFFEDSICKYKGIRNDNFFLYLKECEFKFNYSDTRQREILNMIYRYY